jgi:DNA-binding transcriptional LysR family regulator
MTWHGVWLRWVMPAHPFARGHGRIYDETADDAPTFLLPISPAGHALGAAAAPDQRRNAKCAASDSISALLRSARSGSGFAAVPCDRVPLRISCKDQAV